MSLVHGKNLQGPVGYELWPVTMQPGGIKGEGSKGELTRSGEIDC